MRVEVAPLTEDEILQQLRDAEPDSSPAELGRLLSGLVPGLTQFALISYFVRAFPGVPLRTVVDASVAHAAGGRQSDEDFNRLLGPYLGRRGRLGTD